MTDLERAVSSLSFAGALDSAARSKLVRGSRLMWKDRGARLIARGERVSGSYLVIEGELTVYTLSEEGRASTIYAVRSAESCLLALNALFADVPYPAWVRTACRTQLLVTRGQVIRELFHESPAVRQWMLAVQSQRLFDLISTIDELHHFSLQDRLRSYLLRAADREHCVRQTHEAIAERLGTSREVVTRNLRDLAKTGFVSLGRGRIKIRPNAS